VKNLNTTKSTIINSTSDFIQSMENNNDYRFVKKGLTKHGSKLKLGFKCYGTKIKFILGSIEDKNDKLQVSQYINSFQKNVDNFPPNSFIDDWYLDYFRTSNLRVSLKHTTKEILGATKFREPYSKKNYLEKSVRAESKQAISTLYQIGSKNLKPYLGFPYTEKKITTFLNYQNWQLPWDAGAQFSGLTLFLATQKEEIKKDQLSYLHNYISKLASSESGFYYSGFVANQSQLVNGAMKVISGLEWLEIPIHYPEKLIDSTLNIKPSSEGCDLVDAVYVLYQCSLQTNYKRKEIEVYFLKILEIVELHRYPSGGFSYYLDKSQTHYYGIKVSKGLDEPDLHGTTLLIWAVAMIFNFIQGPNCNLNVLKA
jgi:hypothetical protein